MNAYSEEKWIKRQMQFPHWKYCLEVNHPNYNEVELVFLSPVLNYEKCTIKVSLLPWTHAIWILIYYDLSKSMKYFIYGRMSIFIGSCSY
jgi:hypothetical protein